MGIPTGDIKLSANFELNINSPLDSRDRVADITERDNISFKYAGMIVYVVSVEKHYKLEQDLTTWTEFGSGGVLFAQQDMLALATTVNGSQATLTTISNQPVDGCVIQLFVNGQQVTIGDGDDTKSAYISGNGGETPRGFSSEHPNGQVTIGDTIHWNGSVNNYQLDVNDKLTIMYLI